MSWRLTVRGALRMAVALASLLATGPAFATGEAERIVQLLRLGRGDTVADVGAGTGEWALRLAERVGESGRVYATEVTDDLLAALEERAVPTGSGKLLVVRGDQTSTGLPPGCCDAILLRLVYHHFADPAAMRADLWRALRPGGRLAVVETVPQTSWRRLPEVPDRGGHGIPIADLVAELTAAGFVELERREDWGGDPERFGVVFERPARVPESP